VLLSGYNVDEKDRELRNGHPAYSDIAVGRLSFMLAIFHVAWHQSEEMLHALRQMQGCSGSAFPARRVQNPADGAHERSGYAGTRQDSGLIRPGSPQRRFCAGARTEPSSNGDGNPSRGGFASRSLRAPFRFPYLKSLS